MLPFGPHQAPLYGGSRQNRLKGNPQTQPKSWVDHEWAKWWVKNMVPRMQVPPEFSTIKYEPEKELPLWQCNRLITFRPLFKF